LSQWQLAKRMNVNETLPASIDTIRSGLSPGDGTVGGQV